MARIFPQSLTSRRGLAGGGLFLVLVIAAFGAVVYFLFRGHLAGPREAVAGDAPKASVAPEGAEDTVPVPTGETPSDPMLGSGPGLTRAPGEAHTPGSAMTPSGPEVDAAIAEAVQLVRAQPGAVIQARDKLNKLRQAQITPAQRQTIKDEMAKLSKDWLFGPAAFPGDMLCDTYTVKSGDVLEIIGRRLKTPHEILMQINHIARPQALQAGRSLKVVHGPFHAKVCRSTFTLDLYLQDTYVRSFKVGLGKPGFETPPGLWRVQEKGKLVKPPWTDPDTGRLYKSTDPDYPLGSRWIGLDGLEGQAKGRIGFAIHGTKEPDQIGTAGSRGCIRMYNGEVELMYNLLMPVYSQVEVFDIDN